MADRLPDLNDLEVKLKDAITRKLGLVLDAAFLRELFDGTNDSLELEATFNLSNGQTLIFEASLRREEANG